MGLYFPKSRRRAKRVQINYFLADIVKLIIPFEIGFFEIDASWHFDFRLHQILAPGGVALQSSSWESCGRSRSHFWWRDQPRLTCTGLCVWNCNQHQGVPGCITSVFWIRLINRFISYNSALKIIWKWNWEKPSMWICVYPSIQISFRVVRPRQGGLVSWMVGRGGEIGWG